MLVNISEPLLVSTATKLVNARKCGLKFWFVQIFWEGQCIHIYQCVPKPQIENLINVYYINFSRFGVDLAVPQAGVNLCKITLKMA